MQVFKTISRSLSLSLFGLQELACSFVFNINISSFFLNEVLMCIIDTDGEKSTVVSALINAQHTGSNSFFFFLPNGFRGQRPSPSPRPPESDTPPAVPADSCEDGRILNHVRVTA